MALYLRRLCTDADRCNDILGVQYVHAREFFNVENTIKWTVFDSINTRF